jgi:spermidine synthase
VLAERWLPRAELGRYPDELVFASARGAHRFVVAAAPGGYELFTDAQLTLSSLDEGRRSAAFVRPAFAVVREPRRVLLLHGGTGTLEREILRNSGVETLTVVADDELVRLARNLAWLSSRTGGALESPRVRLIEKEPIVWLAGATERFDVVIDDLPAPIGYGEGKYYTKHYFELLARHLTENGAFTIPATSAFATEDAFASVVATVESAGVIAQPYHVAIPTLGVTSFVVGSRAPLSRSALDRASGVAFDTGLDLDATELGEVSTLGDQRVVAAFHEDREGKRALAPSPEP